MKCRVWFSTQGPVVLIDDFRDLTLGKYDKTIGQVCFKFGMEDTPLGTSLNSYTY